MRSTRTLVLGALLSIAVGALALRPASGAAQRADQGPNGALRDVVVMVDGLRNDVGEVIGGLYERRETWLGHEAASQDCHATIHAGRARCVFHAVSSSVVAFAALHDEDSDGELDRDFVGIPTEGYAFSNDVRDPFGPPSFEAASFSPARRASLVVHARYGI